MPKKLLYVINATAPIRICDLGGWTDTWFAEYGAVLNIGVYPYAEVQIYVYETSAGKRPKIVLDVENFGERYTLQTTFTEYDKHPLLEACIDIMELPSNLSFEVNLFSEALYPADKRCLLKIYLSYSHGIMRKSQPNLSNISLKTETKLFTIA